MDYSFDPRTMDSTANTANTANTALTENGDLAFSTTGDKNLNFFTRIVRGAPISDITVAFKEAWLENSETAVRILMNFRDARKGKQEKTIPILVLVYIKYAVSANVYEAVLNAIIPYGCWKDLLRIHEIHSRLQILTGTKIKSKPMSSIDTPIELVLLAKQLKLDLDAISEAVGNPNPNGKKISISLASKWAPNLKSHYDHHPMYAASQIKNYLRLTNATYRKMLVTLRTHLNVLEVLMSAGQFDLIDFSKVPATAMKKMNSAFKRSCNSKGIESAERKKLKSAFESYLKKLAEGKTKVNVSGIQPHELVEKALDEFDALTEEQWKAIKQRVLAKGSFEKVTAVVDVSGSMQGQPMTVAIALGILVAECTTGPFQNQVITFHESPSWHKLEGNTLTKQARCMKSAPWGGSTDLRAVFKLILDEALRYQLKPEQMVETLFIFTDMQFDKATATCESPFIRTTRARQNNSEEVKPSTFADSKQLFEQAGYKLPQIIFWNLRTSGAKTLPVTKDEESVALLSGFSSELLNCILDAKEFNPIAMMNHVLEPYVAPTEVQNCPLLDLPFDLNLLEQAIQQSQIKPHHSPIKLNVGSNDRSDPGSDPESSSSSSSSSSSDYDPTSEYDIDPNPNSDSEHNSNLIRRQVHF